MSKPFNIHDWQDKQRRLAEQRPPRKSAPRNEPGRFSPGAKVPFGGGDTTTDNDWKGLSAEIAKYIGGTFASWMSPDNPPFHQDYAKAPYFDKLVGGIMDIVNEYEGDEELDEANVTGTGTTISTGESPAYATPHAFAKKGKWKGKKQKWTEQEEEGEEEEELTNDAQKIVDHPLLDKINTKQEWLEVMDALMDHADEISQVSNSIKSVWLRDALKNVGKNKNGGF